MLENNSTPPKHILIFRLSALGDVAMTVPIVLALRQQYPDLKISILSRAFFKPFFDEIPEIKFYAIDPEYLNSGIPGLYKLFKKLSKYDIDAVADLHDVLRTKVLTNLFKARGVHAVSMDKGRADRKKLVAIGEKKIKPIKSIFDRHADVCNSLGLPIDLSKVKLLEQKSMSPEVAIITGEKKNKWIGIAPFATYQTKVYPMEKMEQVILGLQKNGYQIFLFGGGKNEIEPLEKIASSSKNCINMAGKLSFRRELELISNLDLMLSMDSGNGHMAAMYEIPVITLWGNTHPYAGFVPFRQPLENSLTSDLSEYPFIPTSIYGDKIIPGYEDCMKSIDTTTVVEKINNILKES
ncbi:glycosyltransferase family 9 protein [Lutimonas zeaxanthinifaciens]|uniref:glycosyltransferase family 9 protein n=1 Tax=Lutimonas zeaxanthinifaciens TaxID=3060215 RepID=UPI00265D1E5D|nr:glycosyltransferase family 9 protein [Lutimonas sp. YSD2104]WKK65831.1 glycosyltransferase family 9 protein [Lutimonas sp. YSD2104]